MRAPAGRKNAAISMAWESNPPLLPRKSSSRPSIAPSEANARRNSSIVVRPKRFTRMYPVRSSMR